MKTTTKHTITMLNIVCSILLLFSSCVKDNPLENKNEGLVKTRAFDTPFYYYGYEDTEIYLEQIMDKILIRFLSETSKEQMLALISEFASLKIIDGAYWEEGPLRFAALESIDEKDISPQVFESLKVNLNVISAEYMFKYINPASIDLPPRFSLMGITDEFAVKFKYNVTFQQLQKLATENFCTIIGENEFVKNQFKLSVSKTSKLNAMQTSNLFYETGLFEFAEPNFIVLNGIIIIQNE